jgi:hypothetical protein
MAQYNGWSNYETWRVKLEMIDDFVITEYFEEKPEVLELAKWLKEQVEENIEEMAFKSIARDWAMAFQDDCNYLEIAEHLINEYYPEDDGDARFDAMRDNRLTD